MKEIRIVLDEISLQAAGNFDCLIFN